MNEVRNANQAAGTGPLRPDFRREPSAIYHRASCESPVHSAYKTFISSSLEASSRAAVKARSPPKPEPIDTNIELLTSVISNRRLSGSNKNSLIQRFSPGAHLLTDDGRSVRRN